MREPQPRSIRSDAKGLLWRPASDPVITLPHPIPTGELPLDVGSTYVDREVLQIVQAAHPLRFTLRGWRRVPQLGSLQEAESRRLQEMEGEPAFRDRHDAEGNRYPALLCRRFVGGRERVDLTAAALKALRLRVGLETGYREADSFGQEYLVRLVPHRQGYIEVGLSWPGGGQGGAESGSAPRLWRIDEDAQRVMEVILGQVGRQCQNPVQIPAVVFRVLLAREHDPNWKWYVERLLHTLGDVRFKMLGGDLTPSKLYGRFLAQWAYHGAGPGGHGAGAYELWVTPGFLGALRAFEADTFALASGASATRYDLTQPISAQRKSELGWGWDPKARARRTPQATLLPIEAGAPLYHAAAGLTPAQVRFAYFLQGQITRHQDGVGKGHHARRLSAKAADAQAARPYGGAFCPLLPGGQQFHGALGRFRQNAECGWTLAGRSSKRRSARGDLFDILGYELPDAAAGRDRSVRQALDDLRTVVEDYLEGVLALHIRGQWYRVADVRQRAVEELLTSANLFPFLPDDWRARQRQRFEVHMAERVARGEASCAWTLPADEIGAQRAYVRLVTGEEVTPDEDMPLHMRLQQARLGRDLSLQAVGVLFGVSREMVRQWELGPGAARAGRSRGRSISRRLAPLVQGWVDTGAIPPSDELTPRHDAAGRWLDRAG
jgi:hypothetical protein